MKTNKIILNIKNVSKRCKESVLINDMSFELIQGQNISIKCNDQIANLLLEILSNKISFNEGIIYYDDKDITTLTKLEKCAISYIYNEEGYYDRLNIYDYLKLFQEISQSKIDINTVIDMFSFRDIKNTKIKHHSFSQKRRLSFARSFIENPKLIIVHEPIRNLDNESKSIILNCLEYFNTIGISILALSSTLEDTLILNAPSYTLDESGFNLIELKENDDSKNETSELPQFKIEKIPAKVDDKIILINPTEIKYIEADKGLCHISINHDKVSCTLTMNDLENRLKHLGFFRSHRSYLVNLQRIRQVTTWTRNSYSLILDDKEKSSIPLSKGKVEALRKILNL